MTSPGSVFEPRPLADRGREGLGGSPEPGGGGRPSRPRGALAARLGSPGPGSAAVRAWDKGMRGAANGRPL